MKINFLLFCLGINLTIFSQNSIALMKYKGGGDWYANPTSLPNLVQFCNQQINTQLEREIQTVEPGSVELFQFPFVHLTGHGNIIFTDAEAKNLRTYLMGGGFLHADDNYGLKPYFFKAMEPVLKELKWEKLPVNHPIFHQKYSFDQGLPKIHAHDGKPPIAWGVFYKGRMICLFTEECDLGDGWENIEVHGDTQDAHTKALMMGANIIQYVFTQ